MKQHQQSVKCQSHVADTDKVDNTICCDRCGKAVPSIYIWRHKKTIDCMYFPALQLNIPMKVTLSMMMKLPEELTFDQQLKEICDQYKDGYVAPVKVKTPKQLQIERILKEIHGDKPMVWIKCSQKKKLSQILRNIMYHNNGPVSLYKSLDRLGSKRHHILLIKEIRYFY